MIPNGTARDPRLSLRAKGLLLHVLSLPEHAPRDSISLSRDLREGRDAIRAAMRELSEQGYYHTRRIHREGGEFGVESLWTPRSTDDPWSEEEPRGGPSGDEGLDHRRLVGQALVPPAEIRKHRRLVGQAPKRERPLKKISTTNSPTSQTPDLRKPEGPKAKPPVDKPADRYSVDTAEKLAEYVRAIGLLNPNSKTTGWAKDIERMVRIDGVDQAEITDTIDWLFTDPCSDAHFWRPNIRSGATLRAKFLVLAYRRNQSRVVAPITVPLEQSQHPAVAKPTSLPVWFWDQVDPTNRDEVQDMAEAFGFTVEEACAMTGRDPVTFEKTQ